MKNKILLVILVFISEVAILNAQNKYLKGYIIKNKDTINCYIQNESIKELQSEIFTKKNIESNNIEKYLPSQITGFYIKDIGYFISKAIKYRRTNDIMKAGNLSEKEKPIYYEAETFLQIPVRGNVSLYSYIDFKQKIHFFIEKDTVLKELYIKKKFVSKYENGREITGLVVQKNYIGVLFTMLSDCPKLKSKIEHVSLTKKSLSKIINDYNNCVNPNKPKETVEHHYSKLLIHKSVFLGIASNQYKIKGMGHDWLFRTQHKTPYTYTFGINSELIFPELSSNYSISVGLSYYNTPYTAEYDTLVSTVNYNYKIDLSTHYLKLPICIKYTFNTYKIQPYFFAGFFINKIFGLKNSLIIHKYNDFKDDIEEKKVFGYVVGGTTGEYKEATKSLEPGFFAGTGLKYKISEKHSIYSEFNYAKGNGLSTLTTFGNSSTFTNIVVGFEF